LRVNQGERNRERAKDMNLGNVPSGTGSSRFSQTKSREP